MDRYCKILMIFLFFFLSSLCQSLPPFFFSNTDHSSLILSYFLLSPSFLFHADVNTNASLPRRSLSSYGFFFFVFFFLLWFDGWVQMGRSPSTTQCRPPHTLKLPWVFFFFFWWGGGYGLSFMGCNGLMLVGYGGGCGLILVVWLILDFSYGGWW